MRSGDQLHCTQWIRYYLKEHCAGHLCLWDLRNIGFAPPRHYGSSRLAMFQLTIRVTMPLFILPTALFRNLCIDYSPATAAAISGASPLESV